MSSSSSRSSLDMQAISQLPTEQLVAVIAEQQRVIDRLSQERDALSFKLRLDETADGLVDQAKGVLKELYRMILNRLTERLHKRLIQDIYAEMNRINLQHVDFQTQLTQQVADEFVLMHRTIDQAINHRAAGSPSTPVPAMAFDPVMMDKLRRVEALLGYTEYRVDFDPQLPKTTGRFPLKFLTRSLKETYGKFVNYLFKEQRQVNINLLQALQQSSLANRHLAEQVSALQARLDRLNPEASPGLETGQTSAQALGAEPGSLSGDPEPLFNAREHS